MIKIAIVEDSAEEAEKLRGFCNRYASEKEASFEIKLYNNGFDFVTSGNLDFDLIMLDIKMHYMNGMQAAKKIREVNETVVIVFITSMQQQAIHGYDVGATDFIVKPVYYNTFTAKFDRIISVVEKSQKQTITVKTSRVTKYLQLTDIFLVESQRHKLIYHTVSGDLEAWGTMKEVCDKLQGHGFALCNSSYLINLRYVDEVDGNDVLVRGQSYPISRMKRKSFLDALTFLRP